METVNDYLKDCVYFEIYDESLNIMNRYMLITWRWIRGDDDFVFSKPDMVMFLTQMMNVKDRKLRFSFYGKGVKRVEIN